MLVYFGYVVLYVLVCIYVYHSMREAHRLDSRCRRVQVTEGLAESSTNHLLPYMDA